MTRVLFIRHGATAGNLQRRYIGRTDEGLCPAGLIQVEALREQGLQAELLFASPMLRTRQTAEILFPDMKAELVQGLRETDFGIFEAKNADELSDSADYRAGVDSGCQGEIPGGESVPKFKQRCREAFLQCMARVPEGSSAAFVIHGGCIMAILEALALPKKDFYDYHISNGHCIACSYEAGNLRLL